MRNLKRVLSLAMAAAMLIGMMVVSAGAVSTYEDFTDKDEIQNTEAVNTMVSLGVINGKDDGSYFDPNGIVTRAEMAALIARCLNGGIDPSLGTGASTTAFSDTKGHWAEAYIAYCANLGIINGKGDGTFGPDETVTGTAAAKMFLCALGYRSEIEGLTGAGWDLNTDSLANKVGLYDGLTTIRPSDGLNRDNTAQLIYNGVQANEVQYRNNYGEYSGVIYPQPNGTILVNRFKVRKVTGILEANDTLSVANGAADGHGANAVALDGESLLRVTDVSGYTRADYAGLYGAQTYKIDTPNEMVGQEIVIYVKYLNNLSPNAANSTVLGDAIVTSNNTVVETNGRLKDADAVRSAVRAGGLSNIGSPVAFKFDHTGRSTGVATGITDTLTTQADKTRSAGVLQRFIDNNGNGTPDYIIQILPSLATITTVNKSSEKYTFSAPIGSQSWADVVCGGELAKDDILLVTKYSDGKYYAEEPKVVEGEISAFNTGNNKVTVDGTAYGNGAGAMLAIPGATAALDREMIGGTYALYLDAFDNVLGYKEIDAAIGNYAILRGYSSSGSEAMGYSFRVKLLMQDGTTGTYDLNVAETAVKLGLANASDSTSVKEDALIDNTKRIYFNTDNRTDPGNVSGHLYSYSLDNNEVTLSYANNVNSRYTCSDMVASQDMNKNKSSYNTTSHGSIVADGNTVFFFKNADESYSVATGLAKLPSSSITMTASTGESVFYTSSVTTTKAAKAIFVELTGQFTSARNYVFVSGNYTESSDKGTPVYTYPVVFADGTTGTLSSKSNNASKERVWEYETDGDYAKFYAPTLHQYNARIDWIGNGSVGLVDLDSDTAIDSFVVNDKTLVWDVQDTDNVTSSTLAENNVIAMIQDNNDRTVKAVFIYDNAIGDLAGNVANVTIEAGNTNNGTTIANGNVLGGSASITDAVAADTLTLKYTRANADQTVTIKVGGTTVVNGVKPEAGEQTVADAYTLTQSDIDAGEISVSVTVKEADKDTFTKTYTVDVAGPVLPAGDAPSALTLVGAQGTAGAAPSVTNSGNLLTHETKAVGVASAAAGQTVNVTSTAASGATVTYEISGKGAKTTNAAYTLVAGDIGGELTVKVTSTKTGTADWTQTYTVAVTASAPPAAAEAPTVLTLTATGGTAAVANSGNLLTHSTKAVAVTSAAAGNSVNVTCTPVSGWTSTYEISGAGTKATNGAYTLDAADIGANITVKVTCTKAGAADWTGTYTIAVSAPLDPAVAPTALTLVGAQGTASGAPTVANSGDLLDHASNAVAITGAAANQTVNVTCTPATGWTATYTISGAGTEATNDAYTLDAGDIGHNITVVVTCTKAGATDWTGTYEISVAA